MFFIIDAIEGLIENVASAATDQLEIVMSVLTGLEPDLD